MFVNNNRKGNGFRVALLDCLGWAENKMRIQVKLEKINKVEF